MLAAFRAAENQADRLVLRMTPLVFLQPREVEVHLSLVRRCKRPEFQVDCHQATQPTVEEEQIEMVVNIVNPHRILASDEAEFAAEFRKEFLKIGDDGSFEI